MNEIVRSVVLWLVTGVVISVPLWWMMGPAGVVFCLLGPFGILAFKPGDNVFGKVLLATLASSPVWIGLAILIWRWSGLRKRTRILWVIVMSAMWHGVTTLAWSLILQGLN